MNRRFFAPIALLLDAIRSSYGFIPGVLSLLGMLLAYASIRFDEVFDGAWLERLFPGGVASAHATLSTIATAMITIVSLTFSVTIVALTMASSQFGSRLLETFMRDRANQAVLGVLVGVFVYCLIVSWSIRDGGGTDSIPRLSIAVSMILALVGVGALVYFFHHTVGAIQANQVIRQVSEELEVTIGNVFPEEGGSDVERSTLEPCREGADRLICAPAKGLVQMIDAKALVRIAAESGVRVDMAVRAGDYVLADGELAWIHGITSEEQQPELDACIREAVALGSRRTFLQDIEYGILQLVELAVRALSPGLNDPFTAMSCIDELVAALSLIACRAGAPGVLRDEQGEVRVVLRKFDFRGLVDASFNQIRQHARRDTAVVIHLLEALGRLAPHVEQPEHREALLEQARMAHAGRVGDAELVARDRADLDARLAAAETRLGRESG